MNSASLLAPNSRYDPAPAAATERPRRPGYVPVEWWVASRTRAENALPKDGEGLTRLALVGDDMGDGHDGADDAATLRDCFDAAAPDLLGAWPARLPRLASAKMINTSTTGNSGAVSTFYRLTFVADTGNATNETQIPFDIEVLAPKATAVVTIAHDVIDPASLMVRHSTSASDAEPQHAMRSSRISSSAVGARGGCGGGSGGEAGGDVGRSAFSPAGGCGTTDR